MRKERSVTEGERLFIELQLKSAWRKLAGQQRGRTALGKQNLAQEAAKPLWKEIEILGNQYIRDTIFSGQGACVLAAEKDRMFDEIGLVMNRPEIKEKFRTALYQDRNLEEIRRLSMEIRGQVRKLIMKYEAHVK